MKDIDRMPANGGPACLDGNVTVRDYFAAQAMAALVPTYDDPNAVARMAYAHADAMLFARELTPREVREERDGG
jgi:hypothetical protein